MPLLVCAILLLVIVILGGFARSAGVFSGFDVRLLLAAEQARAGQTGDVLTHIMLAASTLGNGLPRVIMIAVVSAVLIVRGQVRLMLWFCGANAGGALLNETLKHIFEVPRPRVTTWLAHPNSFSYPSGHAANAALISGALAIMLRNRLAWVVAIFIAALVGSSRVWLGVHTPSDVTAGWMLGVAWLCGYSVLVVAPSFHRVDATR